MSRKQKSALRSSLLNATLRDVERLVRRHAELELSHGARKRLQWFGFALTHGGNISLTCRHFGIARTTFLRWAQRFDPSDLRTLEEQSRRPHTLRIPDTEDRVITLIRDFRVMHPTMGKEHIASCIKAEHGITVSASTVGRVIARYGFFFGNTPSHRQKSMNRSGFPVSTEMDSVPAKIDTLAQGFVMQEAIDAVRRELLTDVLRMDVLSSDPAGRWTVHEEKREDVRSDSSQPSSGGWKLLMLLLFAVPATLCMWSAPSALALESTHYRLYDEFPNYAERDVRTSTGYKVTEAGVTWYKNPLSSTSYSLVTAPYAPNGDEPVDEPVVVIPPEEEPPPAGGSRRTGGGAGPLPRPGDGGQPAPVPGEEPPLPSPVPSEELDEYPEEPTEPGVVGPRQPITQVQQWVRALGKEVLRTHAAASERDIRFYKSPDFLCTTCACRALSEEGLTQEQREAFGSPLCLSASLLTPEQMTAHAVAYGEALMLGSASAALLFPVLLFILALLLALLTTRVLEINQLGSQGYWSHAFRILPLVGSWSTPEEKARKLRMKLIGFQTHRIGMRRIIALLIIATIFLVASFALWTTIAAAKVDEIRFAVIDPICACTTCTVRPESEPLSDADAAVYGMEIRLLGSLFGVGGSGSGSAHAVAGPESGPPHLDVGRNPLFWLLILLLILFVESFRLRLREVRPVGGQGGYWSKLFFCTPIAGDLSTRDPKLVQPRRWKKKEIVERESSKPWSSRHIFSIAFLLLAAGILLHAPAVSAATTGPQTHVYNGHLFDGSGAVVTTAQQIRFSYWKDPDWTWADVVGTGGAINTSSPNYAGWTEVHAVTPNPDGYFTVELGSITALPDFRTMPASTMSDLFLQVEVKPNGDPDTGYELLDVAPSNSSIERSPILAVPFALNTDLLDQRDTGTASGSIPVLIQGDVLPVSTIPDGTNQDSFTLDANSNAPAEITLEFGSALAKTLSFVQAGGYFNFNDDVRIEGNLTVTGLVNGFEFNDVATAAMRLQVGTGAGLSVTINGGSYRLNGTTTNYAGGTTAVNANATNYLSFTEAGLQVSTTGFPANVSAIRLAEVVTNGTAVLAIRDRRVELSDDREENVLNVQYPEFDNASFQGDASNNVGQLSVQHDSIAKRNYYQWTSTRSSLQDYDIILPVTIPKGFVRWEANPVTVYYRSTSAIVGDNKLDISAVDTAGNPVALVGSSTNLAGTAWSSVQLQFGGSPTWTPGQDFLIRFKLSARDNFAIHLGDVLLDSTLMPAQ